MTIIKLMKTKPPTMPADRGHVRTEQRHGQSMQLDALSTDQFIALMADDHRAVPDAVAGAAHEIARFIDALVPRLRDGGRLIYIGAGTSGRLGVLDASECPPTFRADPNQVIGIIAGGDGSLRKSSEVKEDDANGAAEALGALELTGQDAVMAIAAGGTTPYALGAMRIAKAAGAMTGLLTCAAPPSASLGDCDHLIHLNTGPELLTGSTRLKAGSATKLTLNIISTAVFIQLGKVYSNLMIDLRATNDKLTDRAIRILIELCGELTRAQAAALLQSAQGSLKAALVMQRLNIDLVAADRLLAKHDGKLRPILDGGQAAS